MELSQRNCTLSINTTQHLLSEVKDQLVKLFNEVSINVEFNTEEHYILTQEQALVVIALTKYFEGEDGQSKILSFVRNLKTICKKERYCKQFLGPTVLKKDSDTHIKIYQDSLFRLFLKVPCLQNDVINILLDILTTVGMEETEDTSYLRDILKPLRYLPIIKDGQFLTKKLLDILEISTFSSQLEILDAIPQIIPDSDCDQAARQLITLLDDNDALFGAIIDCLNALNLESDIRGQVQDRILAKLLAGQVGMSPKNFPISLQFLLSDSKLPSLVPTLFKIRNVLDNILPSRSSQEEVESNKVLILQHIHMFTLSRKAISEGWLATVSNIKSSTDHKPIDYLIMFMLHHTSEVRKHLIEGIFRKRISMGLFKIEFLEKLFEKYMSQQILRDYMPSIIEIGCCLVRSSKDSTVAKFSTRLFELLFSHAYTGVIYRSQIISSLISLTASTDSSVINTNLKLLLSLALTDAEKLKTHIVLLMQLLEKLDTLSLQNVKLVFDVLGILIWGKTSSDDSLSGFKNEIHIILRKQLTSTDRVVKHRGILSVLVIIKHMASIETEEDSDCTVNNSLSINNIPEGSSREAACLIELACNCTANSPELLGLYYDQLASILASPYIFDKYFLLWLYNIITKDFYKLFVSDVVPEPINDISFSLQYRISTDTVLTGINIASYIIIKKDNTILLLSPLFRVLRLLHLRQHNENILSLRDLLDCGIILPDVDDPELLDLEDLKRISDCLFHCANWIRELISAFVTVKDSAIQNIVIQRLQTLLEVEEKLFSFLDYIPGHHLPISYFDSSVASKQTVKTESNVKKNKTKKIKSVSVLNETSDTPVNTQKSTKLASSTKLPVSPKKKIQFRILDTDVVHLMKYPLKIDESDVSESSQTSSLNITQVKFLLNDFVTKLSLLTYHKDIGLSHLNDVNSEDLIKDCVYILPQIDKYLLIIVKHIKNLLNETDDRHDLPNLYTDEAKGIRMCFGFILQAFYLVFKWPGFQHTANIDLLKNILKAMRSDNTQTSAIRLVTGFVLRLSSFADQCLELNQAVNLVRTMDVLHKIIQPNEDLKKKISKTAELLLKKRWYNISGDIDNGRGCNENINVLVFYLLSIAGVKDILTLLETIQEQIGNLSTKEDCLHDWAAIDKRNFHVFYLGICNALLESIKFEIQALTNREHLEVWLDVFTIMADLKLIAISVKNRTNTICFLKKSIGILKVFLTHGLPILEIMLKVHPQSVIEIFRIMHSSTRYMHKLCCESKLTRDARVITYIPAFRHILESIVYRAKAAFCINNMLNMFHFGYLPNKNLQDELVLDVPTQSTNTSVEDEIDDENELFADDTNLIIDETNMDDGESCDSEVYN
ncbi:Fanconi anemia group D2 protein homolog [Sitophilus oryzae]|uniref:Fanconi anemia group D2 protein homolog n=1 Tax=Sitophilus oryzae TaxID=7048 RepID=A0A6J2YQ25_SITOR|nr:Fanconi anemia group D2 protein homolog [Sitophilus oryzae]